MAAPSFGAGRSSPRRPSRKNLDRYVHTRGFNRLAGRPTAPGSVRPETAFRTARLMFLAFMTAFFAVGLWFVFR